MMAALDLFSPQEAPVPDPEWIEVLYPHPVLDLVDQYRCRVVEHPTRHLEVQRRLRPAERGDPGGDGWAPVRWHIRVRQVAQLAGLEP
jgi:hypothetical protein